MNNNFEGRVAFYSLIESAMLRNIANNGIVQFTGVNGVFMCSQEFLGLFFRTDGETN